MADNSDFTPISLDTTLDDIEDLPQFLVFPTGAYVVQLIQGMEEKDVGEHKAITVNLTLTQEPTELDPKMLNKGEEPPKMGDVASLMFMMDNKFGAGQLKNFCAPLAEHFNTKSLREIVENSKGLDLVVVLQRTYNKEDGKFYQRFSKVAVL